jgi:hypothetical protein
MRWFYGPAFRPIAAKSSQMDENRGQKCTDRPVKLGGRYNLNLKDFFQSNSFPLKNKRS